jgi:glutaredoxin
VGATLIVSFTVPRVAPDTRSVVFATRTCPYCGKAKVWIDNDFENGRIVDAKIDMAQTSVNVIALRVNPGVHTLTISVLEPANVTVAGVMLGPPDGPY